MKKTSRGGQRSEIEGLRVKTRNNAVLGGYRSKTDGVRESSVESSHRLRTSITDPQQY
jgi:hypothetical protein